MSSSRVNLQKYLIPLDEITRATENFSHERCIGGGGFGAVYKAELPERWHNNTVAIKRLDANSRQGETEFRNELEVISKFQHENIIAFVGYCDEGGEMIIVYEYALNGSLDQHLQDPSKMRCITWKQRLEICIGAARGLHYLHSGLGEENRVIHRDVKSANILLDGNMVAKICDFGLSKLGTKIQPDTQVNTKVAGTQFYLDPTYHESGILRRESDVYSFGVVLFEILSGMLVYGQRSIGDELQSLMNTVRRYHQKEPYNVTDPGIQHQIKVPSFDRFKEIAYQCISFSLTDRPTFATVIEKLEEALKNQRRQHYDNIPADRSFIESVIDKLNSVSPDDLETAVREINSLTQHCDENRAAFGQAGAIPRLTHLLTAPDSLTQQNALIALSRLSLDKRNTRIIIDSGAVPVFLHILENGSNEARDRVAVTIYNFAYHQYNPETIGSPGAIPPLVLLLSEGTTPEKESAAGAIARLCRYYTNTKVAITAGLVPILIELLTQSPQGVLKERSIAVLAALSTHPQGSVAIGEAGAVPHLVEIIGNGSRACDQNAVTALQHLCDTDQKYLVEAQKVHGVMGKLKVAQRRDRGTLTGGRKALELRRQIKHHQRCTIM